MIGAFVLLGACDSGGGTLPTNPIEATEDSIATGARLYQGNCLICHGTDGRGSPLAPDLTVHVLTRKDGFLFERISRGFPADSELKTMPSFGSVFSEMERWHLVNFLRETFKGDFVAP